METHEGFSDREKVKHKNHEKKPYTLNNKDCFEKHGDWNSDWVELRVVISIY